MTKSIWEVHKFGGSSLADADCFRKVADILLAEPTGPKAVIVSAMGGKTDALLNLVSAAEASGEGTKAGIAAISQRYRDTVAELVSDPNRAEALLAKFDREISDATDVLQAVALVRSAARGRF